MKLKRSRLCKVITRLSFCVVIFISPVTFLAQNTQLNIQPEEQGFRLVWQDSENRFLLQTSEDLGLNDNWNVLLADPSNSNGKRSVFIDAQALQGSHFYQLILNTETEERDDTGFLLFQFEIPSEAYILEGADVEGEWITLPDALLEENGQLVLRIPIAGAKALYRIRPNTAPLIDGPASATAQIGEKRTFVFSFSDLEGDTLKTAIQGLPSGAKFEPNSGQISFNPQQGDEGVYNIQLSASDGASVTRFDFTLSVPDPPVQSDSGLTGRLLDANDAESNIETPIAGAKVSLLGTGLETFTDANGTFHFDDVPAGIQTITFDPTTVVGTKYAGYRNEFDLVPGANNLFNRPVYLPQLATSSMATASQTTPVTISNDDIGVSMVIAAGSASNGQLPYEGDVSISLVPRTFTPSAFPRELNPAMIVTVQPVGVRFDPPAPITFPNIEGFAPGTELELQSLDPATGRFAVVGTGRVSVDGQRIETVSGGVPAADWMFMIPNSPILEETEDHDPADGQDCPFGSDVLLHNGALLTEFSTPPYFSMGREQTITLRYRSDHAEPKAFIPLKVTSPGAFPDFISLSAQTEGVSTPPGRVAMDGERITHYTVPIDATNFPTGEHVAAIEAETTYPQSSRMTTQNFNFVVVNRKDGPYGAGWSIAGVQKIFGDPGDPAVVLVEDTNTKVFERGLNEGGLTFFEQGQQLVFPDDPLLSRDSVGGTTADLDNDGDLDLIVLGESASGAADYLRVFLNQGDGVFVYLTRLLTPAGGTLRKAVAEDFDGDGNIDLAIAAGTQGLLVSRGLGAANFESFQLIDIPFDVGDVVAGEFDGNTGIDLLAANALRSSGGVFATVYPGNGDLTFGEAIVSSGQDVLFNRIAVADFNGDQKDDFVAGVSVTNLSGNGGTLYFANDGAGRFTAPVLISSSKTLYLSAGDFDNNGSVDLVGQAFGTEEAFLARNNGTGSFTVDTENAWPAFPNAGNYNTDNSAVDVDGDGNLDALLISANNASPLFAVAFGDGSGEFDLRLFDLPPAPPNRNSQGSTSIIPLDANEDGFLDVVVTRRQSGISYVPSKAARNFFASRRFKGDPPYSTRNGAAFGDLNGDGLSDEVSLANLGLNIRLNQGNGTFGEQEVGVESLQFDPRGFATDLSLSDMDGDSNLDALYTWQFGSTVVPVVVWGANDGKFTEEDIWIENGVGDLPSDIAPGDFDGDGRIDYVDIRRSRVGIAYQDTGGRTFSLQGTSYAPPVSLADTAAVGDINNDGIDDVIVFERDTDLDRQSPFFTVLLGQGDRSLDLVDQDFNEFVIGSQTSGLPAALDVGFNVLDSLLVDVNVDGNLDLIVATSGGVFALTGSGNGRFALPINAAPDLRHPSVSKMVAGDLDGDGREELVLAGDSIFSFGMAVLPFTGGRTLFDKPSYFNPGFLVQQGGAQGLLIEDLDRDGMNDLTVVHNDISGSNLATYLNDLSSEGGASVAAFASQYQAPPGDFTQLRILSSGGYERTYPDQTVVMFDELGRHISTTDSNGNTFLIDYAGSSDLVTTIIDPMGIATTLDYDSGSKLQRISNPAGVTEIEIDEDNHLMEVRFPGGSTRKFEYKYEVSFPLGSFSGI